MAQTAEELEAETARLKKLAAKIEAETALLKAQQAKAEAERVVNPTTKELQDKLAALKLQRDVADAQKALDTTTAPPSVELLNLQKEKAIADAEKDFANSQTDALKAKYIGTVAAGTFTGHVTRETGAGNIEGNLLATRAARSAAEEVARRVLAATQALEVDPAQQPAPKVDPAQQPAPKVEQAQQLAPKMDPAQQPKPIYVFGVSEFPDFQRLVNFRFRKELIAQAFKIADVKVPATPEAAPAPGLETVAVPALAGAGLEALTNLLKFFKTDYTVGGIDAKVENSPVVFSVAGKLRAGKRTVYTPAMYSPRVLSDGVSGLIKELETLVALRGIAETEFKTLDGESQQLQEAATKMPDGDAKKAALKSAADKKAQADRKRGAATLYDAFATSLTTPDASGVIPMTGLAQEATLSAVLKSGGDVLLVRTDYSGGGYLVKKNIVTGLGGMPLEHSGGAVVSFLMLTGADGRVLDGGVVTLYGGYVKPKELAELLR